VADDETTQAISNWSARGVTTTLHACDITDEAAVSHMLSDIRAIGALKTVIHAAMVLDDALIENLTDERVRIVIEPKAKAAAILDRQTRQDDLDHFILFSSATTLVGNPGQANYVAANGYLEGIARARRRIGLPALAVGFGAISDTGFVARNKEVNERLSKRLGKTGMTAGQALSYLEDYLSCDPGTVETAAVAIADIDMNIARHLKTVAAPLFEVIARSTKAQSLGSDGDMIDLAALVEGKSPEEGEQVIFQLVAAEIAKILRIPASEISPLKVIREVGLDSLMAMELGMSFRQKTGFEIPLSSVTQSTTVGDVSHKLYLKITQHADTGEAPEKAADVTVVDQLAMRHTTPVRAGLQ
jgi:acyl carrier protein